MAIALAVAAVAAVVDSGGRSSVASTAAAAAAYGSIERAGIRRDHAIIRLEPVGVHTWEMSSIPTW